MCIYINELISKNWLMLYGSWQSRICRVGQQRGAQERAQLPFTSVGLSYATAPLLVLSVALAGTVILSVDKILFILQDSPVLFLNGVFPNSPDFPFL